MLYRIIKGRYIDGAIDAAKVWEYADAGKITESQAMNICGTRPLKEGKE